MTQAAVSEDKSSSLECLPLALVPSPYHPNSIKKDSSRLTDFLCESTGRKHGQTSQATTFGVCGKDARREAPTTKDRRRLSYELHVCRFPTAASLARIQSSTLRHRVTYASSVTGPIMLNIIIFFIIVALGSECRHHSPYFLVCRWPIKSSPLVCCCVGRPPPPSLLLLVFDWSVC
jgi:hypothetical protein